MHTKIHLIRNMATYQYNGKILSVLVNLSKYKIMGTFSFFYCMFSQVKFLTTQRTTYTHNLYNDIAQHSY